MKRLVIAAGAGLMGLCVVTSGVVASPGTPVCANPTRTVFTGVPAPFFPVDARAPGDSVGDMTGWMMTSVGGMTTRGGVMGTQVGHSMYLTMGAVRKAAVMQVLTFHGHGTVVTRGAARITMASPRTVASPQYSTVIGATGTYLGSTGTLVATRSADGTWVKTLALCPGETARVSRFTVVSDNPHGTATAVTRNVENGTPGPGTERKVEIPLLSTSNTPVGVFRSQVMLMGMADPERGVGLFSGPLTYDFGHGNTIRTYGNLLRALVQGPELMAPYTAAVTGGTGRYAGVKGQVRVAPQSNGTARRTFTLLRHTRT
jgi:hypothetical protein